KKKARKCGPFLCSVIVTWRPTGVVLSAVCFSAATPPQVKQEQQESDSGGFKENKIICYWWDP
ncbi:hypothetical protein L4Z64_001161, partial [Pseudomonas aeruginosa]